MHSVERGKYLKASCDFVQFMVEKYDDTESIFNSRNVSSSKI